MKITAVKPWVIETDWDLRPGDEGPRALTRRQFVFVKVETDEGVTGWGEITTYPGRVANPGCPSIRRGARGGAHRPGPD